MRTVTPLRYPGGKACLAPTLSDLLTANELMRPVFAEPYAGGAGASLELLFGEHVDSILINDLDYRIFAFWWSILNRTEQFVHRLQSVPLCIREWKKQRAIYRNFRRCKRFDVGFATFYLNRTNRSGILVNGGPIGGIKQLGRWGLDARFTRSTLTSRIERIAAYRDRIIISNVDALTFITDARNQRRRERIFFYLDPPYYEKGAELYLSVYHSQDHAALGNALRMMNTPHWALTYDDVPEVHRMYSKCRIIPFSLRYTAHRRRKGNELLILPKGLRVPFRVLQRLKSNRSSSAA